MHGGNFSEADSALSYVKSNLGVDLLNQKGDYWGFMVLRNRRKCFTSAAQHLTMKYSEYKICF